MLITCPTCASSYRINAAKIGPEGRSVRCAACRETWFLTPSDGESDASEKTEVLAAGETFDPVAEAAWADATLAVRETVTDEEADAASVTTPKPAAKPSLLSRVLRRGAAGQDRPSWPVSPVAILALTVLAAMPVVVLARNTVVGVMPRTAALFAAIGLPVNRRGLEIRGVVAFQNAADEDRPGELVIEGDVVGVGRGSAAMPGLLVAIADAAGKPVRIFTAPPPRPQLAAGEAARFKARLADPPASGRTVSLRFADTAGAPAKTAHD